MVNAAMIGASLPQGAAPKGHHNGEDPDQLRDATTTTASFFGRSGEGPLVTRPALLLLDGDFSPKLVAYVLRHAGA